MVNEHVSEAPIAGQRIRVLIAESNTHVRTVLSWALTHDPRFTVVANVADGDSALDCQQDFDVALVDLSIHGRGGFATVANLHRRRPAAAVVALSRVDALYLRHAAAADGAADFVVISDGLDHLGDRLEVAAHRPRHAPAIV